MFKQNFKLLLYKSYNIKCIALVTMKFLNTVFLFKKKKQFPYPLEEVSLLFTSLFPYYQTHEFVFLHCFVLVT